MTQPLTVIIPAGNSADVIEHCLQSVRWAEEVLVVDSFTTDGTSQIAERYADRVVQHEYGYSALQKNWAIPQARHEWVLIVDTDERVTESLRHEIQRVLESDDHYVGYKIPRLNYILGRPIRSAGYYPDYQLRLFRRDRGRYALRQVHAHVQLDGPCGELQSPLIHYAHRSLDQTARSLLLTMTTWEATQRATEMKSHHRLSQVVWFNLLTRPVAAFGLRYVWQGGWRDGYRGLALSMIWAMYVALTYLKIWEDGLDLPERWWQMDWQNHNVDRPDHS